jgi:hypothetical protein
MFVNDTFNLSIVPPTTQLKSKVQPCWRQYIICDSGSGGSESVMINIVAIASIDIRSLSNVIEVISHCRICGRVDALKLMLCHSKFNNNDTQTTSMTDFPRFTLQRVSTALCESSLPITRRILRREYHLITVACRVKTPFVGYLWYHHSENGIGNVRQIAQRHMSMS